MMDKANYIIFHPDNKRQSIKVQATAMVKKKLLLDWKGDIYVDQIGVGNEDPFVFTDPWLSSYCHATQLRRNESKRSYLQVGSKIIFASGQQAEKGILTIDTVFLVGGIQKWGNSPLELPSKYLNLFRDNKSPLWKRHLRFPFFGHHKTVSHTYEADLWNKSKTEFSFLPLDGKGNKISISLEKFNEGLLKKITGNVKGKYPVLLTDDEIHLVVAKIEGATTTKVLKLITSNIPVESKIDNCSCS